MFVSTYKKEGSPPTDAILGDKLAKGQGICERGVGGGG